MIAHSRFAMHKLIMHNLSVKFYKLPSFFCDPQQTVGRWLTEIDSTQIENLKIEFHYRATRYNFSYYMIYWYHDNMDIL